MGFFTLEVVGFPEYFTVRWETILGFRNLLGIAWVDEIKLKYCSLCTVLYVLFYMYCSICIVLYVLFYIYTVLNVLFYMFCSICID